MGWKTKLIFDVTDADTILASDSVGAYVRSSDGTLIDHQTINSQEWLNTASALFDSAGNGITSTGNALDVNIASSDIQIDVDLDHTEDSVRLGDGTNYFTSTSENSDIALDVHISNSSIAVTASDLDIRDLVYTSDSVTAYQGTDPWVIGDGGNSITVDASDLDIRDLAAATDSVSSWTKDGAGTSITSTVVGADTGLDVNIINSSIVVNDAALANTAIANDVNTLDVADTRESVVASALANRKYLYIFNNTNKRAFVGGASVTQANGFPLDPANIMELRAGAAVDVQWIAATLGHEIRHMELS
ncbi:MAG TPA: hypothetical protein VI911_08930 [Patescibacteria group bacterium]|nr:MAG: hypothetical protein UR43_C0005G0046 [candidate division TM6 bacterium GW2011_GWF2_33_332]HLD91121.1 hypothetical protein [Patescibacteria group bacterium]